MGAPTETPATVARGRCRCGHFPTHHMLVRPIGQSASYRLDPGGSCILCGEGGCRRYSPAGAPDAH